MESQYDSIPVELKGQARTLKAYNLPVLSGTGSTGAASNRPRADSLTKNYDAIPGELSGGASSSSSGVPAAGAGAGVQPPPSNNDALYDDVPAPRYPRSAAMAASVPAEYAAVPAELYGGQTYPTLRGGRASGASDDAWLQEMMPDGRVFWKNRATGEICEKKPSDRTDRRRNTAAGGERSHDLRTTSSSSSASRPGGVSTATSGSNSLQLSVPGGDGINGPAIQKSPRLATNDSLRRNRVIYELIVTEEQFVMGLGTLVQYYYLPLRGKKKIIAEKDASELFGNVVTLLRSAEGLVHRVRELFRVVDGAVERQVEPNNSALSNTAFLCRLFVDQASLFALYTEYAKSAARQTELLRVYMRKEQFVSWTERQRGLHRKRTALALEDLLVLPVQRACRYAVFFRDLLRFTEGAGDAPSSAGQRGSMDRQASAPSLRRATTGAAPLAVRHAASHRAAALDSGDDELTLLTRCADRLQTLADHVSQLHETAGDAANSTASVASRLEGYPLGRLTLPGRRVLISEQLKVTAPKSKRSHERMCFLFTDLILWAKKGRGQKLLFEGLIPLQNALMSASSVKQGEPLSLSSSSSSSSPSSVAASLLSSAGVACRKSGTGLSKALGRDTFQLFDRTKPTLLYKFKCVSSFSRKKWTTAIGQRIDSFTERAGPGGAGAGGSEFDELSRLIDEESDALEALAARIDEMGPKLDELQAVLQRTVANRRHLSQELDALTARPAARPTSTRASASPAMVDRPAALRTSASEPRPVVAGGDSMCDLAKDPVLRSFYKPTFSRQDCLQFLQKQPAGAFVLRNSSKPNCYAASYFDLEGKLYHSLIYWKRGHGYCFNSNSDYYPSVLELLREHCIYNGD